MSEQMIPTRSGQASRSTFPVKLCVITTILLSACDQGRDPEATATPQQDSLVLPVITVLAELPDSSRPKTIYLDSVPAPLTVGVPTKAGGSYTVDTYRGPVTFRLKPPQVIDHVDTLSHMPIPPEAQGTAAFTNFSSDEGLPTDNIACGMMDRSGTLWFGTDGAGIARYDGQRFTTIGIEHGLAHSSVFAAMQDRSGHLWFGTGLGASRYDGRTFTNFSQAPGLDASVRCILEDRAGNMWFGTVEHGVTRYDGKSFTTYTTKDGLANDVVRSIIEDRDGNIWFGTAKGLSRFDPSAPATGPKAADPSRQGRFTTFTTADGLMGDLITCLLEDASGNIWIGGKGGLSRYDGTTFTNYSTANGLHSNSLRCLYQDPAGTIWIGGDQSGLTRYDGQSFVTFTTEEGLSNNNLRSITPDRYGSLWLGTVGGGVSRYDGPAFANFKYHQWVIHQDATGMLWFAGRLGLMRYDMTSSTWYGAEQGLATENAMNFVEDDSGNFWCGSFGGGVVRFDPSALRKTGGGSFTTYTTKQGLAGDLVWTTMKDRAGHLWFGTHNGAISHFDGRSFTNYTNAQGLAGDGVNGMLQDRAGVFWFGTDEGLTRFDGERFTTWTTAQGLAGNEVVGIAEDGSGNLWFGTNGGVSMLSASRANDIAAYVEGRGALTGRLFENYTTMDGLPGNTIYQVLIDGPDRIYLGGTAGLCELLRDTGSANAGRWKVGRSFTSRNGFPVKDVISDDGSLFKDRSGIIWIATNARTKLVRFDPAALHTSPTPELVITGSRSARSV
ncbi:MAG: hypothetical protein IPL52_05890 [Flavobacteriales bacterium]|nr:hypothetical protein [Flavobacteriales bacterium]